MTLGGQWNPADGVDPSVDDTSLIQTVHRYTMTDLSRMDFLAIRRSLYYLFQIFLNVSLLWMHGETNGQWLAHKKAVAERERQLSLKKERSSEKKDGLKDKEKDSSKDVKRLDKSEKKEKSPHPLDKQKILTKGRKMEMV